MCLRLYLMIYLLEKGLVILGVTMRLVYIKNEGIIQF